MKISACLVVYHEEKLLERCLKSLRGVADEIIVVHDGPCRDNTLLVARRFTKKVYVRPRFGEAEPHRPFSFAKATGDWVMQIDADEYLSEQLRKKLRKLLSVTKHNGMMLAFELPYGERILPRRGLGKAYRLCLFRKGAWSFDGTMHGQVRIQGSTGTSELLLHHRPSTDNYTFLSLRTKWRRWAKLQAQQMIERKKAPLPGLFYLIRAPIWAVFYFMYFIPKGIMLGIPGIKIALLQALYNSMVQYYLFAQK